MVELESEERSQMQLERLQSTLNRAAKNVPFHRRRLLKNDGNVAFLENIEDIAGLPFMERKDLEEHYPYGLFAVPLRDIVRIHTAPGSFEHPTVSGYTKQDLNIWRRIVAEALASAQVSSHDILQIYFNPGLADWGRNFKDGAENLEAGVIPNTSLSIEKQVMVIRDYKTSVLITTPATASRLADFILNSGSSVTDLNLRALILAGEPIHRDERKRLQDILNVEIWLQYGLSEVPGPSIAYECSAHHGLHVNETHFLPEIIDPSTGAVLPAGKTGELALTTLTTRAFPLIRFKTGDRARIIENRCQCGNPLRRIEWFSERTDDMLVVDGVKVNLDQVNARLKNITGAALVSKCFIGPITRDYLEIWIEMDQDIFSDEIKILEKIIHDSETRLRESIGAPVIVRLKEKKSF